MSDFEPFGGKLDPGAMFQYAWQRHAETRHRENTSTPGPWVWTDGDSTLENEKGDFVLWFGGNGDTGGTSEANARLIAAAPDLLDAARLALSVAESWIHDQQDGTSSLKESLAELDPVRAAIAKATGDA